LLNSALNFNTLFCGLFLHKQIIMWLFHRRYIIISFFLALGLFNQCRMPYHESQLHGLWMGVYTEFTPVFPMPVLNEYRPDGTVTIKRFGKDANQYNWALNQSTLTIDTTHCDVINCDKNTLLTRSIYKYLFRRVNDAPIEKDEGELRAFLQNTSWKSEGHELHFDREKVFTFSENKMTEIRCWNIEKYADYAFLYQTGHAVDCDKSAGRAVQIIEAKNDKLHLSVWNETGKHDLIYKKKNELADFDSLLKNKPFQLCGMYNTPNIGGIGNLCKGGDTAIKNHFYDNYNITKNVVYENGFIILQFIINCEAEAGGFELIGMDKNYKPQNFHEDIGKQLIDLTKSLNQWIPYEYDSNSFDAKVSINFRITNGQIKVVL